MGIQKAVQSRHVTSIHCLSDSPTRQTKMQTDFETRTTADGLPETVLLLLLQPRQTLLVCFVKLLKKLWTLHGFVNLLKKLWTLYGCFVNLLQKFQKHSIKKDLFAFLCGVLPEFFNQKWLMKKHSIQNLAVSICFSLHEFFSCLEIFDQKL